MNREGMEHRAVDELCPKVGDARHQAAAFLQLKNTAFPPVQQSP